MRAKLLTRTLRHRRGLTPPRDVARFYGYPDRRTAGWFFRMIYTAVVSKA